MQSMFVTVSWRSGSHVSIRFHPHIIVSQTEHGVVFESGFVVLLIKAVRWNIIMNIRSTMSVCEAESGHAAQIYSCYVCICSVDHISSCLGV